MPHKGDGYVPDPTRGLGYNIGYGAARGGPQQETLSAPTASMYCKTCRRGQPCATTAVARKGGGYDYPWRCTVCGNAPHVTPPQENKAGRRFG